ncbi:tetratricopeptide repeat protein [Novosphingobium flavum]|uniref:Tetratricopeptide repeat protein n=2 Tax=Novosphingobium flavum TaxID=1778672 RepID=A0A7X1FRV2_9SPHN|nr:tetratricopeptide repeat protein [Novosphingobium flavum]
MREVDEALREQEVLDALKRHGRNLAIVIIVILVGLAGYLWWEHSRSQADGEKGEQLTLALDQLEAGRFDPAAAQLKPLAAEGKDGIKAAAVLTQAGMLEEQGKAGEAQKLFAQVAADAAAPQPYRDLATIREIAAGFEGMTADSMVARLKPLAAPGNPFFGSAGELLGMAYVKQGRNDLAGPLFAAISRDKAVPTTLRGRARQMAGLLGVDAVDDVNEAANSARGNAAAPAPEAAPAAPANPAE